MRRIRFSHEGLLAMQPQAWGLMVDEGPADRGFDEVGDAAVVSIRGPLVNRADSFWAIFCDSYESIRSRVDAAMDSQAKRVILCIDSPGGEAAGCFELARDLRAMAAAHGKPLIAYAENCCASAAYAIATAADPGRLLTSPTAYVGSIGVFEAMIDVTGQNKALGLNVVVVASGAHKVDRNPDVPITEQAIGRVQAQVDQFAGLFFDLCSEMRGGNPESYAALQGGVLLGAAAVGGGLADAVAPWSDVIAGVAPGSASEGQMATKISTKASKYDEAIGALRRAAEEDGDDGDKAKKALKAIEDGDEPEKDGEKPEKDAKAKATEENKDQDPPKAAEEEKDPKAMALANAVDLGRQVAELRSQIEARDRRDAQLAEQRVRQELLARRPDFTEPQRKTLAMLPVEAVKDAVENWPRAAAAPGSSAAATTPAVTGGEGSSQGGYVPRLSAEEQRLLDRCSGRVESQKRASVQGNVLQMPAHISQADALARVAELDQQLAAK